MLEILNKKSNKIIFFLICIIAISIDQIVKLYIIQAAEKSNPIFETKFIDIILVFNKGVAFSLLSFASEYLKWIILVMLFIVFIVIIKNKEFFDEYYIPFALIIGSGFSNLIDRFIHNGVVDYIYWHYGFNFAVFNLADSVINISIALIFIKYIYKRKI
ncbi:signal peptidase II [Helicobacter sp. MIT 14-3879]|uniref:signal peptidase II n=1 Tax=Helicobacter sp. MIT 14-3879 TaxID=2040649 RepID=UPI000E1E938F|nr:signal peptidase II [Helicobacter sp. MIT 14-3879]RDU63182.1 lipoprotein signal peptidase [Helicobacter sp. MIT 14-3879]